MIKMLTAFTDELDYPDAAVRGILSQLDLAGGLFASSVGLLYCAQEFVEAGVVKALCERLPFPVVGANTFAGATEQGGGPLTLSLAILTSDDISFSVWLSEPLGNTPESMDEALRRLDRNLREHHSGKAQFYLTYFPHSFSVSGEDILRRLDEILDKPPLFGSLPIDYTTDIREPRVLFAGESYSDRIAVIGLHGDVRPKFFQTAINEQNFLLRKAVVTSSEGCYIKEINGRSAICYLEKLGLAKDGKIEGIHILPILLCDNDGTPRTVRIIQKETAEGYIQTSSQIPPASVIRIGTIDYNSVMKSAEKILTEVLSERSSCLIMSSCMSRNIAIGLDYMAEINLLGSIIGTTAPYIFMYSGGEICPVREKDSGLLLNRFHNTMFVICAL
jgi:hypothetical protein